MKIWQSCRRFIIINTQRHQEMGQNANQATECVLNHPTLGLLRVNSDFFIFNRHCEAVHYYESKSKLQEFRAVYRQAEQWLFIPLNSIQREKGLCSSEVRVQMFFERCQSSLWEQIRKRKQKRKGFQEQEIWYMLKNLVDLFSLFEEKYQQIAFIHPKNILLNARGNPKLISKFTCLQSLENKFPDLQLQAYFSPQQLRNDKTVCNGFKDSFSIGMVILSMLRLQDVGGVYKLKTMSLSHKKKELMLQGIENYSNFLMKTVRKMVEEQLSLRPSVGQIKAILQTYHSDIINLKKFEPLLKLSEDSLKSYKNKLRSDLKYRSVLLLQDFQSTSPKTQRTQRRAKGKGIELIKK